MLSFGCSLIRQSPTLPWKPCHQSTTRTLRNSATTFGALDAKFGALETTFGALHTSVEGMIDSKLSAQMRLMFLMQIGTIAAVTGIIQASV